MSNDVCLDWKIKIHFKLNISKSISFMFTHQFFGSGSMFSLKQLTVLLLVLNNTGLVCLRDHLLFYALSWPCWGLQNCILWFLVKGRRAFSIMSLSLKNVLRSKWINIQLWYVSSKTGYFCFIIWEHYLMF